MKLDLPGRFDGMFANASLSHVASQELHMTLKLRGVLFSSNHRGGNEEGWNHGRYGVSHDLESWRRVLKAAGFSELTHDSAPTGWLGTGSPGSQARGVASRKRSHVLDVFGKRER